MLHAIIRRSTGLLRLANNNLTSNTLGTTSGIESRGRNKFSWWSGKKNDVEDDLKVIKPQEIVCDQKDGRFIDPECKVAIVLGGSTDMGLSAADSLLFYGAQVVILADDDERVGKQAAHSLCNFYGKNRARFIRCDLRSFCQLEGVFEETMCMYKKVDVLFSNLDRNNSQIYSSRVRSCKELPKPSEINDTKLSKTAKAIRAGLKYMSSDGEEKSGGIIINGTSIVGFMGWPEDPVPIYCFNKEPVAETTMDLAKMYPVEETGVRILAILRSHRPLAEVGLPDFPNASSKSCTDDFSSASPEPPPESRIGKALVHLMSRAPSGTTWLTEPAPCTREIPWQIHFPDQQGETIDPRIYEEQEQNYVMALEPMVAASSLKCHANCGEPPKCKKFW